MFLNREAATHYWVAGIHFGSANPKFLVLCGSSNYILFCLWVANYQRLRTTGLGCIEFVVKFEFMIKLWKFDLCVILNYVYLIDQMAKAMLSLERAKLGTGETTSMKKWMLNGIRGLKSNSKDPISRWSSIWNNFFIPNLSDLCNFQMPFLRVRVRP